MQPTVLAFSSHEKCNYIHNDWIAQRALRGNHRILFLPLSASTDDADSQQHQEFNWSSFRRFFDQYRSFGLDAFPFYWHNDLQRSDVERLWEALGTAEVVILGGGRPRGGMRRFHGVGAKFFDDPNISRRILFDRRANGLLTVGFSAGVDQLLEHMASSVQGDGGKGEPGFGLARRIVSTVHFEQGAETWVAELARRFPDCAVFGLPNDSGLAVSEGKTHWGKVWQVIETVIDTSWDNPEDAWHIKTRQGILVQHFYPDGRHWGFRGGDKIVRIFHDDGGVEAFLVTSNAPIRDYWSQNFTSFANVEHILWER
jgi:peptidase E